MAVTPIASDTGPAVLPDTGTLRYNGIQFSCLYRSELHGSIVEDDAKRATKLIEWNLEVEGEVTLPDGVPNTDASWRKLRNKLETAGVGLVYQGNGSGQLNVGGPIGTPDVAWGPVPKILSFKPYGAGRGAKIEWQVTVRVFESTPSQTSVPLQTPTVLRPSQGLPMLDQLGLGPVLQYNYESRLSYNERGYSRLSLSGTLEIPLSSLDLDAQRRLKKTVDNYRQRWLNITVDLTKFRVTGRDFRYSRDKRTVNFEFTAEELPPMGLPVGHTDARGTMSCRQIKVGKGAIGPFTGVRWALTLRATYCVAKKYNRRTAWSAFYALLAFRMRESTRGFLSGLDSVANDLQQSPDQTGDPPQPPTAAQEEQFELAVANARAENIPMAKVWEAMNTLFPGVQFGRGQAILADFGFEEGLYLDSETITFEASWMLFVRWQDILVASGVWRHVGPDSGAAPEAKVGGNPWAISVGDISGWTSWLDNKLDPKLDVIVDLGGGAPPYAIGGLPPPVAP